MTIWLPPVSTLRCPLGSFEISLRGFALIGFVHTRRGGHIAFMSPYKFVSVPISRKAGEKD